MKTAPRWTSANLDALPDNGKRYEIIDVAPSVSKQPHWHQQYTSGRVFRVLDDWNRQTGSGRRTVAPGVIFSGEDNVVPDVVWGSNERFATLDTADTLRTPLLPGFACRVAEFFEDFLPTQK